jgi:hypothetical protein
LHDTGRSSDALPTREAGRDAYRGLEASTLDARGSTDALAREAAADAGHDVTADVTDSTAPDSADGVAHDAADATSSWDAADACGDAISDALNPPDVPVFTLDAGTTWRALYRDYFGPSGVASCAGGEECHGSTLQLGYESSNFLCPAGDAEAGCYAGITSWGTDGADLIQPDASFSHDMLSEELCQGDGAGTMPLDCSYVFTPVDMKRIADWVNAGALDN